MRAALIDASNSDSATKDTGTLNQPLRQPANSIAGVLDARPIKPLRTFFCVQRFALSTTKRVALSSC